MSAPPLEDSETSSSSLGNLCEIRKVGPKCPEHPRKTNGNWMEKEQNSSPSVLPQRARLTARPVFRSFSHALSTPRLLLSSASAAEASKKFARPAPSACSSSIHIEDFWRRSCAKLERYICPPSFLLHFPTCTRAASLDWTSMVLRLPPLLFINCSRRATKREEATSSLAKLQIALFGRKVPFVTRLMHFVIY